jgi:NAD+ diphosphatase
VRYVASQPWPFSMSLMLGCFARVQSEDFVIDPFEIDGARWFDRDEVYRGIAAPGPELGFSVPGKVAIAHHIIKAWCEGH